MRPGAHCALLLAAGIVLGFPVGAIAQEKGVDEPPEDVDTLRALAEMQEMEMLQLQELLRAVQVLDGPNPIGDGESGTGPEGGGR